MDLSVPTHIDPARSPAVRVVMMQKDEGDALLRWLSHYAGLFGFENLVILDNGSVDELTRAALDLAESRGSRVRYHLTARDDWRFKGRHMLATIQELDRTDDYDFALPVDCDELLAVFTGHGLSIDHDAIRREFLSLVGRRCALSIDLSLFNHPTRADWYIPNLDFPKGFVPARSIEAIDDGQHSPVSRLQAGSHITRLAYLHMHNKDHRTAVRQARMKLRGRVDVEDRDALIRYVEHGPNPGMHLVGTLLASPEQFEAKFLSGLQVYVPGPLGATNFISSGTGVWAWDADRYLASNADVRGYEQTGLHHYLRYGYREGRSLGT